MTKTINTMISDSEISLEKPVMLLSIVIPIYNKESVLQRTLDSIESQGLREDEYEIILIDDGSTDKSLSICKLFQNKYPQNVKVITKENEGLSKSRDLGINLAKGIFIYFMDADDYILPSGLRFVIDHFLDTNLDIIVFSSSTIPNFDSSNIPSGDVSGVVLFEGNGCDYLKSGFHSFVWNQFYKLDFIKKHEIYFDEMYHCEDVYFNLHAWSSNPIVRITSSKIYRYIEYPGTFQLTKSRESQYVKKSLDSYMRLFHYLSSLNNHFKDYYSSDSIEQIFESVFISYYSRLLSYNISVKEFRDIINNLHDMKLLPMPNYRNNKTIGAINIMLRCWFLFPLSQLIYKSVILPYVIPRIDRETGKFKWNNRK